jgi:hypothetical protein
VQLGRLANQLAVAAEDLDDLVITRFGNQVGGDGVPVQVLHRVLLERPDPVVSDDRDDRHAVSGQCLELESGEPEGAVSLQQHHLPVGVGELRRERVSGARSEAPKRSGIEPAAGLKRIDQAAGERDEVATVADHDRVAVEHAPELAVDPHRVQRRALVDQPLGLLRPSRALDLGQRIDPPLSLTDVAATKGGDNRIKRCR